MSASVQTIKKFCEETGISETKVNELINDFIIPTIPKEQAGTMTLINKLEFDRRIAANQITLPIPPRKRKQLEKE